MELNTKPSYKHLHVALWGLLLWKPF